MEKTTKFVGGFLLLVLLLGHLLLLGFFFAPTDKLIASVLSAGTALIEVSDIPPAVEDFLITNKIEVKADTEFGGGLFSGFVMEVLELRMSKFMTQSEQLAMHLNLLSFGEDVIGIEAASQYYFKKPVSQVSDTQWITLINLQKMFSK